MKTLFINERQCRRITEDLGNFQAPDTVYHNKKHMGFKDKEAIPFFVLFNGTILYGISSSRHIDYIDAMYPEHGDERENFIRSIMLQGRFWRYKRVFSLWSINFDEISENELCRHLSKISNHFSVPITECFLAYRDKTYKIFKDDDAFFLKVIHNEREYTFLTPEKLEEIDRLFCSNYDYVKNKEQIYVTNGYSYNTRRFNPFECFCRTVALTVSDYLHNTTNPRFTINQFRAYLNQKYNLSLNVILNYFHTHLRNKSVAPNQKTVSSEDFKDDILKTIYSCHLDSGNVQIKQLYDGTNYSYNVKILGDEYYELLVDKCKEKGYILDRFYNTKILIPGYEVPFPLHSFRIRRPYTNCTQ